MSNLNRSDLVFAALKQAGRGPELKSHTEILLNSLLRKLAFSHKYPQLKKVGAVSSLSSGQSSVTLPSDYGAGMERLLMGTERICLQEKTTDEFADLNAYYTALNTTGRPTYYTIDLNSGRIQFNSTADQAYDYVPIYFCVPADIPAGPTGDTQYPWFPSDEDLIEALIARIYQYTEDPREFDQKRYSDIRLAEFRNATVPLEGGSSRIRFSPSRFRRP